MSTTTTEATTVVEYGVKYTWPSGHIEIERFDGRRLAEGSVRMTTSRYEAGEVPQTAELVTREVTTTAWEVAR